LWARRGAAGTGSGGIDMTAIMAPPRIFLPCVVLLAALALRALADDGRLLLTRASTNLNAQVRGSEDDDWRIEVSTNLEAEWSQAFTIDSAEKPPNRSCANSYKRIAACAPRRAVYRHSCYSVVYINKGYDTRQYRLSMLQCCA
jgi:hypothetical protein